MLEPITRKSTDESDSNEFKFSFYCDVCGKPWHSIPWKSDLSRGSLIVDAGAWDKERADAYERANLEALTHYNRCPVCKRMVCDTCFRILDEMDMCKECAAVREVTAF